MTDNPRAVFDCNVLLQALISPAGPSGRSVELALDGRVTLFCSAYILDELRETASNPALRAKFTRLTDATVNLLIENLERVGRFPRNVPEVFVYPRDPDDAHYVNLGLVANARYIVSRDRDLLDLAESNRPDSLEFLRRFGSLQILEPESFLKCIEENGSTIA